MKRNPTVWTRTAIISRERKNKQTRAPRKGRRVRTRRPFLTPPPAPHRTSSACPDCFQAGTLLLHHLLSCQKKMRAGDDCISVCMFAAAEHASFAERPKSFSFFLFAGLQQKIPYRRVRARLDCRAGSSTPTLLIGSGIFPSKIVFRLDFFNGYSSHHFDSKSKAFKIHFGYGNPS